MSIAKRQTRVTRLLAGVGVLLLAGCAPLAPPGCAEGQQPSTSDLLYFGTATPDGTVTLEQWTAFLGEVVTPRFPAGFTTWDAAGQWRGADGSLTRESSRVLNLVHDGTAASGAAVSAIVDDYKQRFRQEAVLRVHSRACVSF